MAKGKYDLMVALKSDVKDFKRNMHSARGHLKQFAQSAGPSMALMNTQAGRFLGTFQAGQGAIRAMIPALHGVKAALVSTGIGAILVAIGVAIAGVNAYINRTVEGSNNWKKAWSAVKATTDVLLDRLADVGGTIVGVIKGTKTLKEAWQDVKGAVTGVFDEANQEAAEAMSLQERENTLWREKLDFMVREAELRHEISDLVLQSRDITKSSEERQRIIAQAQVLQNELSNEKVRIAREELAIAESRAALGHNSKKDEEELAQLQVKVLEVEKERNDKVRELVNRHREAGNALSDQEKMMKKIADDAVKIAEVYENMVIPAAGDFVDIMNEIPDMGDDLDIDTHVDLEPYRGLRAVFDDLQKKTALVSAGIGGISSAFTQLAETGVASTKAVLTAVLTAAERIIQAYLAEAIAGMIASESKKGLIGLITASVGVAGLMALWRGAVPEFAAGGIVKGDTLARVGEYPGAAHNPEIIAPLNKLKTMMPGGNVTFRIHKDELVGVLEYGNFMQS